MKVVFLYTKFIVMKVTALRPILWTTEFEATLAFYTTVLGFTIEERNDAWGWACLQLDGVEVMISKPVDAGSFSSGVFTGSLYFTVSDVEALWEKLRDSARVCYALETFEWGMKEFAIYDNNGYVLQWGEEV
jgi:uncharacterized glyoxalase superfamily protein PhnB